MKLWTKTFFILISFFFIVSLPFLSKGSETFKGGLNFLLLVLAIGLILFIIFVSSNIKIIRKERESVPRKKLFTSSFNFGELGAIFVPILFFLLIIFGLAVIAKWSSGGFDKKPHRVVERVVETPKKAPAIKRQVQYATLSWVKPAGVRGGNPYLRRLSSKVVVHKISDDLMEFTVIYKYNGELYKSRFMWDKSKKYGEWSQNSPYDYGEWFLLPTNNPRIFVGKISDKSGIFIPLRLELS